MPTFPFVFGLAFFLRIFVPGLVGGFVVTFFVGQQHWFRDLQGITTLILLSGLIGMGLRVLYVFVGEFLVGEYWPGWFRLWRVRVLNSKLKEAQEILQRPPSEFFSNEGWRYFRAGRFVQLFPFDLSGNRTVAAPTLFGNILQAPLTRLAMQYGFKYRASRSLEQHMTYVFTRLWFHLPARMRREISDSFAEIEALLGSWTAAVIGAGAFFLRGIFGEVVWLRGPRSYSLSDVVLGRPARDVAVALLLVLIASIIYKVILKRSASGGVVYEAIFSYVSPAELEEVIEESKKALASQTKEVQPEQNPAPHLPKSGESRGD